MGNRLVGDNRRGLHDHILMVMGPRGDSDLVDPVSRDSNRRSHNDVSLVKNHIGHGSVSREMADVIDEGSQGTCSQLVLEQYRHQHRQRRPSTPQQMSEAPTI